jgi:FkbH-like protein
MGDVTTESASAGGAVEDEVVLAGTFVLDLIAETTSWWLSKAQPSVRVSQTAYGQLLESLHDPAGPLRTSHGVHILIIRPDDWLRNPDATYALSARATEAAEETMRALTSVTATNQAAWLVAVPPPSPALSEVPGARAWVSERTNLIARTARDMMGMHFVDVATVADQYQVPEVHDEYGDRIAHLPYTDTYMAALGTWLARAAHSLCRKPRKLVILDCDNTLWSGVCGEDGPENVVVSEPFKALQRFMLGQRSKGKLLALCSHNNEAEALAVFGRPDMELRLDDITIRRIGWDPKPRAIAEMAAELGFATEAVIFVDDDPVECALAREQFPDLAVFQVPEDPADIPAALMHEWAFDQLVVTEDDRLRADRYAQESRRREVMSESDDYADFLRRCHTEVSVERLNEESLERAAQLSLRTTQFNLSSETFTPAALWSFLKTGEGWTVRVWDRFGDYGTVGMVLTDLHDGHGEHGKVLRVRSLLMSCRVLNRGVETEVIRFLQERAREAGCSFVQLSYRKSTRNTPARLFLEKLSGRAIMGTEETVQLPSLQKRTPVDL